MLNPWSTTTRPCASVIHRPSVDSGGTGAPAAVVGLDCAAAVTVVASATAPARPLAARRIQRHRMPPGTTMTVPYRGAALANTGSRPYH